MLKRVNMYVHKYMQRGRTASFSSPVTCLFCSELVVRSVRSCVCVEILYQAREEETQFKKICCTKNNLITEDKLK